MQSIHHLLCCVSVSVSSTRPCWERPAFPSLRSGTVDLLVQTRFKEALVSTRKRITNTQKAVKLQMFMISPFSNRGYGAKLVCSPSPSGCRASIYSSSPQPITFFIFLTLNLIKIRESIQLGTYLLWFVVRKAWLLFCIFIPFHLKSTVDIS